MSETKAYRLLWLNEPIVLAIGATLGFGVSALFLLFSADDLPRMSHAAVVLRFLAWLLLSVACHWLWEREALAPTMSRGPLSLYGTVATAVFAIIGIVSLFALAQREVLGLPLVALSVLSQMFWINRARERQSNQRLNEDPRPINTFANRDVAAESNGARRESDRFAVPTRSESRAQSDDDPHVVTQLTRLRTDESDSCFGVIRGELKPGEFTATLHALFHPPFELAPETEATIDEFESADVKIAESVEHGVRFDVRFPTPATRLTRFTLRFEAEANRRPEIEDIGAVPARPASEEHTRST